MMRAGHDIIDTFPNQKIFYKYGLTPVILFKIDALGGYLLISVMKAQQKYPLEFALQS